MPTVRTPSVFRTTASSMSIPGSAWIWLPWRSCAAPRTRPLSWTWTKEIPRLCCRRASKFPEVFVTKGRDGKTDIWGTITRPLHFDPSKKYPVIENIYAGPQGSFVPKTFSPIAPDQALAELGFIVVHIDGMGTSNRSKAFHDVAYEN